MPARSHNRVILGVDNTVAVAAITKGYSSCTATCNIVRKILTLCKEKRYILEIIWIPTKENAASPLLAETAGPLLVQMKGSISKLLHPLAEKGITAQCRTEHLKLLETLSRAPQEMHEWPLAWKCSREGARGKIGNGRRSRPGALTRLSEYTNGKLKAVFLKHSQEWSDAGRHIRRLARQASALVGSNDRGGDGRSDRDGDRPGHESVFNFAMDHDWAVVGRLAGEDVGLDVEEDRQQRSDVSDEGGNDDTGNEFNIPDTDDIHTAALEGGANGSTSLQAIDGAIVAVCQKTNFLESGALKMVFSFYEYVTLICRKRSPQRVMNRKHPVNPAEKKNGMFPFDPPRGKHVQALRSKQVIAILCGRPPPAHPGIQGRDESREVFMGRANKWARYIVCVFFAMDGRRFSHVFGGRPPYLFHARGMGLQGA